MSDKFKLEIVKHNICNGLHIIVVEYKKSPLILPRAKSFLTHGGMMITRRVRGRIKLIYGKSDIKQKNIDLLLFSGFFRILGLDHINVEIAELNVVPNKQIPGEEAIHKINLQGLFDLSYDQFLEFTEREIRIALEKGADITDLDTVRFPLKISYNEEANGVNLFQEIKDIVWERDGRVCTQCKSNGDIGFYPIIPFEKGGSSTYRNMRLMCAGCSD